MFQLFAAITKTKSDAFVLDSQSRGSIEIKDPELHKQFQMIELTESDLSVLKSLQPIIKKNIKSIVDQFYTNIEYEGSLMDIIDDHSSVERLKKTLTNHIQEMFNGVINEKFIHQRKIIAEVHVRIGLQPKWYMCSFQDLLNSLLSIYDKEIINGEEYRRAVRATTKILNFEQQIVLELFEQENLRIREEEAAKKAAAYRKIDEMSEELAAISQQASASTEQLTEQSDKILGDSKKGTEVAQNVEAQSTEGKEQLEVQQSQMNHIQLSIQQIKDEMEKLKGTADEISQIVTIVSSIAEQTNLLSLNASIEAARAGEHGAGFTVVANEVRKLSEQTKSSVSEVSELIQSTNGQIHKVSHNVGGIEQLILEGTENMNQINDFFTEIVAAMARNKEYNSGIEKELEGFSQVIQEINEAVAQVAASSQQLTEVTEQP
ncbi:globin-coupled sensor protein [Halobacillus sp. A5]|uniref:globin-coupled sensor protein n=1 Tax=Halobacillus sp. A5 TaxID=2880263 RepID=UPI0020A6CF07|nr:globin-coupled sensor protein [Halobacillus sp. A5]MCP3027254.1 globin-coupled sensor protein [Halobacillus sp. A5]